MQAETFREQFPFAYPERDPLCSEGPLLQLGIPGPEHVVIWFLRARAAEGPLEVQAERLDGPALGPVEVLYQPWEKAPACGRLSLGGLSPDTQVRLRVTLDGAAFELSARTAPSASSLSPFRFLAFSCFAPFAGGAEKLSGHAETTLAQLARCTERPRDRVPDFALGLGDQVYVDDGRFIAGPRSLVAGQRSRALRYAGDGAPLFDTLYRAHFSLRPFHTALSQVPSAMMWDDHEVRDLWGSHGDEPQLAQVPAFRAHLEHARRYFLAFQALRNPMRTGPDAERHMQALEALTPEGTWPETHFAFDWGRDTRFFVMDQRSARRFDPKVGTGPVVSDAQLEALAAWLEADRARGGRLYVLVSPIPLTQPRGSKLERAPFWPLAQNDARERFWHPARHAQGEAILRRLAARFSDAFSDRLLILSGDVHYHEVRELTLDHGRRVMGHEVISSGLAQPDFGGLYRSAQRWNEFHPAFRETGVHSRSLGRHIGPGFVELCVTPQLEEGAAPRPPRVCVAFHLAERDSEATGIGDPCDEAYELSCEAPVRDAPNAVRAFLHPRGRTRIDAVKRRELELIAARRTARRRRQDDAWYEAPDRANLFGVALSGGGIRSATLSLGFLKALHQRGVLEHVDYLSSVSGGSYANGYLQASAFMARRSANEGRPSANESEDFTGGAFAEQRIAWLGRRGAYLALGAGAKGTLTKLRLLAAYAGTLLSHWAALLAALFFVGSVIDCAESAAPGLLPTVLKMLLFAAIVMFVVRLGSSQMQERAAIAGTRLEGSLSLIETGIAIPLLGLAALWALGECVPWAFTWPSHVAAWSRAATDFALHHAALGVALAFAAGACVHLASGAPTHPLRAFGLTLWVGLKYAVSTAFALAALFAFSAPAPALLAMFSSLEEPLPRAAVSFGVMLLLWALLSPNSTSMHRYFAARIMDTFLRTHEKRVLAAEDELEEGPRYDLLRLRRYGRRRALRLMKLRDLQKLSGPYPLFNACVNLIGSDDEAFAGVRASDYFVFAPDHCGAKLLGYGSTEKGQRYESVSVAEAVGCSAAAVSPFQGTSALSFFSVLLWLLNLRTDLWLPHPTRVRRGLGRAVGDRTIWWGPWHQLRALLGMLDTQKPIVNVSDGGFIDNLGVIELLRRRCRLIVALDNTWDPHYELKYLRNAVVRARQELGLSVDFLSDPRSLVRPSAETGLARHCFAVASVSTPKDHPEPWPGGGLLVYVKACEVLDPKARSHGALRRRPDLAYRTFHPEFPHEPTTDQFFNAEQWHAYFELGKVLAEAVLANSVEASQTAGARAPVSMSALERRFEELASRERAGR